MSLANNLKGSSFERIDLFLKIFLQNGLNCGVVIRPPASCPWEKTAESFMARLMFLQVSGKLSAFPAERAGGCMIFRRPQGLPTSPGRFYLFFRRPFVEGVQSSNRLLQDWNKPIPQKPVTYRITFI